MLWIIAAIAIFFAVVASSGCSALSQDRISIARATRLPEEVNGFARVIQEDPVEIGIIGETTVAKRSIAGYCVVHEQDLAQLIRNTEELHELTDSRPALEPPCNECEEQ